MGGAAIITVFRAVAASIVARIKMLVLMAALLIAVFAAVALFSANPLATFLKLLSWSGIALMLVSAGLMLLTFNRAKEVVPAALLAALIAALLGSFLSVLFSFGRPTPAIAVLSLLAGGVLGVVWAHTTVFFIDGGRVRMKGSPWYLAVWVLTLVLNQAVVLLFGHAPEMVICLTLAGAGLAVGNTAGLLLRSQRAAAFVAGGSHHA